MQFSQGIFFTGMSVRIIISGKHGIYVNIDNIRNIIALNMFT